MAKYRKGIVWTLMIIAIILFWLSLRSESDNFEFTLAALGVWLITFLLDRYLKNEQEKE